MAVQERVATAEKGQQSHGIHGGKFWTRGDRQARGVNVKAQQKLARRVAGYEKDAGANRPGEGLALHKPGSLNVNNR